MTFTVDCGVAPLPWVQWLCREGALPKRVRAGHGLWRQDVRADRISVLRPGVLLGTTQHWEFERGSAAEACAVDLQRKLTAVVPTMVALLDRETFAAAIEAREVPPTSIHASDEHALACLFAGNDDRDRVEDALHRLAVVSPSSADWFRCLDASFRVGAAS